MNALTSSRAENQPMLGKQNWILTNHFMYIYLSIGKTSLFSAISNGAAFLQLNVEFELRRLPKLQSLNIVKNQKLNSSALRTYVYYIIIICGRGITYIYICINSHAQRSRQLARQIKVLTKTAWMKVRLETILASGHLQLETFRCKFQTENTKEFPFNE